MQFRLSSKLFLRNIVMVPLLLSGCATLSGLQNPGVTTRPAASSVGLNTDWHWSVTGDSPIRPIQVFSFKSKTYLQMRPGQVIPAVIVGGKPVPFAMDTPYIIVSGTPQRIDLIAQGYRALILHLGPATVPKPKPALLRRLPGGSFSPPHANSRFTTVRRQPVVPVAVAPEIARLTLHGVALHQWQLKSVIGGSTTLRSGLQSMLLKHGYLLHWQSPINQPLLTNFTLSAPNVYSAIGKILDAASPAGWRYFFYVHHHAVYVTATREKST